MTTIFDKFDEYKIPILDIGDSVGHTMYIDFIDAEDMEFPIMCGKDRYGRKFLVIKGLMELFIGNDQLVSSVYACQTFFQRYPNEKVYVGASNNFGNNFLISDGGLNAKQLEVLELLVQNKELVIDVTSDQPNYIRLDIYSFKRSGGTTIKKVKITL
jgi:hypothetical protein